MSKRIRGITVEIGGDTTKLQDALKDVNKEIKNTESQLRDVNKLLKLDPGNTELLVQKHKLLGQAIDETKNKLATLKEAQQSSNQALAQGTITSEQYDALQREIFETEQALKSLEKQAHHSNSSLANMAVAGEQMQVTGGKIKSVGQQLMPVTGVITGLGIASVKTAADFDEAMSQVLAVSGATGDEFEALRDKAREMGAKTKFSATDAANAMNYMAMAGWRTEDMIKGIDGIMNLAAASGEDLALTSDIVTDALTAFGLQASDSAHFADVMAAASASANTNVSMMGETFKYAAPIAGALGYTVEDTALAIGLMANAGIKSSQAGTSLRKILTELQGELVVVGDGIGEIAIQTTNADGNMRSLSDILFDCREAFSQMSESEQIANAEMLVGKEAMSGFLAIMNAAPSDVEKLTNAIENADGSAEKMATTMQDNLAGQIEELKSALEELAISFGDILMPVVRNVVSILQGLVDGLNMLPTPIKSVIAIVLTLVAAIGPVLLIVGQLMQSVGSIMLYGPKLIGFLGGIVSFITGTLIPAIGSVLAAIGPIPLAIGAIIGIITYLWNTSDWFRESIIGLWEEIKTITVNVWSETGNFLSTLWTHIVAMGTLWWNNLCENISRIMTELGSIILTSWQWIKSTTSNVVSSIYKFVVDVWQAMGQWIHDAMTMISDIVSNSWRFVAEVFNNVLSSIYEWVESVWNGIVDFVVEAMSAIWETISNVWSSVQDCIIVVFNTILDFVASAFGTLISLAFDAMDSFYHSIANGFGSVLDFIGELISQASTWGWDLIIGIVNGINDAIGHLINAVGNVAEIIWSYLHFSVPEIGPLSEYESWMPDFMQGLADGINKSRYLVANSMDKVTESMTMNPEFPSQIIKMNYEPNMQNSASSSQLTANGGDIVIPVYLGGTLLDEVIVNAQMRQNIRSGGR